MSISCSSLTILSLLGVSKALRSLEIEVQMVDLVQSIDNVFTKSSHIGLSLSMTNKRIGILWASIDDSRITREFRYREFRV